MTPLNRISSSRLLGTALALVALPAMAQRSINSLEIAERSVSLQCLNYMIEGVCVWLDCSPVGCDLVAVPRIRHFSPDVVVSAYHETGKNPWSEMSPLIGAVQGPLEGGVAAEAVAPQHTNLRFKNVDAIGNPLAATLSTVFAASGLICDTPVRPFQPYFISTLDTAAWRFGIPEALFPESLVPGVREIRGVLGPLATWGSVYPRSGFLVQAHDYKAAAVTAQRAANVITQEDQPHVYRSIVAEARDGYWPPGEALENDPDSAVWQMLLPEPESECHVFADIDDLGAGAVDPYAERIDEHGDYVWNLWRPYECCDAAGDVLLFAIDF